ncbi:MAG: right-handed parallel beta-helix repeat-containing protein [Rhodothermales bacterium]
MKELAISNYQLAIRRAPTLAVLLVLGMACGVIAQPIEFYVAPSGSDAGSGSQSDPFATLVKARDAAREQRVGTEGLGATIWIRGGIYSLDSTFVLNERDSGTSEAPVVFRSWGDEEVRLIGGVELPASSASPVTDVSILDQFESPETKQHVVVFDLPSLGITNYGQLKKHGHGLPVVPAPLELFFNHEAMTLARYPNEGSMKIGKVIDPGSVPRFGDASNRGGIFEYTDPRHKRWVGLDSVWFQGTFMWGYADDMIRVASIDTTSKQVKLSTPHMYGIGTGAPYRQYVALNILSELDSPGEWYLDRDSGKLYFWPPAPLENSEVFVSMMEKPLVELMNASFVTLRDVTVEFGRGMGIYMEGGEHDMIAGCTVRNVGTTGILMGRGARQTGSDTTPENYQGEEVSGEIGTLINQLYNNTTWNRGAGHDHTIRSCDVYNTGAGGVFLSGGDRSTLTPGNSTVENCRMWNNQRRNKFLWAGINVDGVGNRVAHNEVFDSDYQGIMVHGNDHVFEYNDVHDIGMDSDDTSPWYMGRDPSARGNIIRYNYFHDVGRPDRMGMGVYLDDGTCGTLVYGNVFKKVASYGTVYSNSGSDNIVMNNVFIDGFGPAFHLKSMWYTWAKGLIPYYFGEQGIFRHRLLEVLDIRKPPYSTRYPKLTNYMDLMDDGKTYYGMIPSRNVFARNLVVNYEEVLRLDHPTVQIDVHDNWTTNEDPGFYDVVDDNFALKPDAKVFTEIPGFKPIPFAEIGTYGDEWRK